MLRMYSFGITHLICETEICSLETRNAVASSHERKNINILVGEITPSTKPWVFSIGHISNLAYSETFGARSTMKGIQFFLSFFPRLWLEAAVSEGEV